MHRRRLHILIAVMVLAFCRLLRDATLTPAPAQEVARIEEHPTTTPASGVVADEQRDGSWDWLFVRSAQPMNSSSDGGGQSTDIAAINLPTMHGWMRLFPAPDSPQFVNRSHQTDEALRLVGGLFDDHFKTPEVPWVDPPVSPTPHEEDLPATPQMPPAPPPALAVVSDPIAFNDAPAPIVIPLPPPVGGPSSLPPVSAPITAPIPEPGCVLLPVLILLLAARFPARA